MKPSPRNTQFEKVIVGDFITGTIDEIQRDENHKSMFKGQEKVSDCVRFKFKLDGYEFFHYSRWMTFTYGEKSTLFTKYLAKLVPNAHPDMDYDIENLKGMRVKTLWAEKNDFQTIESIFPLKDTPVGVKKPSPTKPFPPVREEEPPLEEDVPPDHEEPPF